MRIIHSRKRLKEKDNAFCNKFTLLTWILSIIKWKEFSNEVVLYTDRQTLQSIKNFGFEHLYDEINVDVLESEEFCKNIDFRWFWAMPKIISLYYETQYLNNEVVIADMDVFPMQDLSRCWTNAPVCVWSNKEYVEFKWIYPDLYNLSLAKSYKFPEWFTGKAKPLNTGIIHFKDNTSAKEYCEEVFKYVKFNDNCKNNSTVITMCNAEQRMLGEFLKHKNLTYTTVQPVNAGTINKNAVHTHGYKNRITNQKGILWNSNLLKMIQMSDSKMYEHLTSLKCFQSEKEFIESEDFKWVPELKQYYENS